jgi:hypothetical protein
MEGKGQNHTVQCRYLVKLLKYISAEVMQHQLTYDVIIINDERTEGESDCSLFKGW